MAFNQTSLQTSQSTKTSRTQSGSASVPYIPPSSQMIQREAPKKETEQEESVRITRNVFAAAIFGFATFVHSYILSRS
jgi:hypothetical protein